jgi:starch-binding outer membrane protein SusE/F
MSYMKKNISPLLFLAVVVILGGIACSKMTNAYYHQGSTPNLQASSMSLAPATADSLKNVFSISWTNPNYSTDSATVLYTIQIDSSGRNFSKATSWTVTGAMVDSFSAKQLNTLALGYGFKYNVASNLDVRVISSYANNNEQLMSNTVTISYTPYVTPPKVAPPATKKLYLIGSASADAWNNPVPVSQQFEMVDSVDYAGVFNLSAGGQYLLLPLNGDWTNKYAVTDASVPAAGGAFGYNGGNSTYNTNFNGPAAAGWYEIWVNFQTGTYTVTPYTQQAPPDSLFLVGSATADGWNNPVPEPSQVFTQISSTQWQITAPLSAAGAYLMLPVNGSWTNKYAVASGTVPASGGSFGYNLPTNFNGPANAGTYTITADFLNYTYTVTP